MNEPLATDLLGERVTVHPRDTLYLPGAKFQRLTGVVRGVSLASASCLLLLEVHSADDQPISARGRYLLTVSTDEVVVYVEAP